MNPRLLLATGLGLGHAPVAPGTVASLATLPLALLLWSLGGAGGVLAGAGGHLLLHWGDSIPVVGASGAVSAARSR